MTLEEYWEAVYTRMAVNPSERAGQAAFNVLVEERPDLSEEIRTTSLDPFYARAGISDEFCTWLYDNWEK